MKVTRLNNAEFVRVSGPDAMEFLQGQLTCDMKKLSTSISLTGAICNLKGRVIANFQIALDGKDILLRTSIGMADQIIGTLIKYAVFSKVELSKDERVLCSFGLLGSGSREFLAQHFTDLTKEMANCCSSSEGICIQLPSEHCRFELWCTDSALKKTLEEKISAKDITTQWHREDILAGIVHIGCDTSERYTPQLLNYDISGVIDFNKGCYTGQEIVARMYYRGSLKKRLYLLASDFPVEQGANLLERRDNNVSTAEVLSFCNSSLDAPNQSLLLAILNAEAVDDKAEFVMSNKPDSVLKIQSLSYT
ncbi:MAG: hypothetical protein CMQ41_01670 [Gammaproteobacteria bacterium]|nr:hypothetical protein [Gammaproteobacteria bacterium]